MATNKNALSINPTILVLPMVTIAKCDNSNCDNTLDDNGSLGHCYECVEAYVSYLEAIAEGDK